MQEAFQLGDFEVRPAELSVRGQEASHQIEPKSMQVLIELARNPGQTIGRESLIEAVWPRGFVSDDVLNRCISQLRRVLGDSPRDPRYIATIPRRGYRLVASVTRNRAEPPGGILVLPFQNLAPGGEDEYLADGLTELLIARLSVGSSQRVISRTTAMSFKDSQLRLDELVGDMGVTWIIEGSLLQLAGQLQIVVQLIDAGTDTHLWADTWTRPVEDLMSVLNEVTRQVAGQIRMHLEGLPASSEAKIALPEDLMRRYLQGNHHASRRTAESLAQAAACFEEVLAEVPDHAPALAGRAMCHVLRVHYGAEPAYDGIPRARELALHALAIDPGNAEAMAHLGAIHFFYDWDFEAAGARARQSLAIRPQFELALMLAANVNLVQGRYERSQSLVDRAIAIDPLNVGVLMNAGDLLILQRRYGEAIRSLSQALELQSRFRPAVLRLALAQALQGIGQDAMSSLEQAREMGPADAVYHEYQALICARCGDGTGALAAAREVERLAGEGAPVLPWSQARAWAAAGDEDRAIACLYEAYDTHSSSMPFLGQTPVFSELRERGEVRELMRKVGLPA